MKSLIYIKKGFGPLLKWEAGSGKKQFRICHIVLFHSEFKEEITLRYSGLVKMAFTEVVPFFFLCATSSCTVNQNKHTRTYSVLYTEQTAFLENTAAILRIENV